MQQRLLNEGAYTSLDDLAVAEKISPSYISRILRLAHLSLAIVEAILEGRHPAHLTMKDLLVPFPPEWEKQRCQFLGVTRLLCSADLSKLASIEKEIARESFVNSTMPPQ